MDAPIVQKTFRSEVLGNERRIWLQSPQTGDCAERLCILLDGEYYVERMDAPAIIADLQAAGAVVPFATAFVSHVDGATRWAESFCNSRFAEFVAKELLPWLGDQLPTPPQPRYTILGGLSLTGLAAAHVALLYPECCPNVLCQSASFWWSESWLVTEFRRKGCPPLRFRITCGRNETEEYVQHGPELIQRTSQLACNRAMRGVLEAQGCSISYEEFEGGHDLASWKRDLSNSLKALLEAP
jgi:enterochelin esterase family protein